VFLAGNNRRIARERTRRANEIAEAYYLPGRAERLERWSPEFLARLGDFPDPHEVNSRTGTTGMTIPA
jgi:hypothetical protein